MSRFKQWASKKLYRSQSSTELAQGVSFKPAEDEDCGENFESIEKKQELERQQWMMRAILRQRIVVKAGSELDVPSRPRADDDSKISEGEDSDGLDSFSCSCQSCSHHRHGGACKCQNCRALANLTECGVCYESLQSSEIRSCRVCANVVCEKCAGQLSHCAFCRADSSNERNRALERLVNRLLLPCKNSRSGCAMLLNGERRFEHESQCAYSQVTCPLQSCSWSGLVGDLGSHLRVSHLVKPIFQKNIYIEIYDFRSKVGSVNAKTYPIYIIHQNKVFKIVVKLHQNCLRIQFSRVIPQETSVENSIRIGIKARDGRQVEDLVVLDNKHNDKPREFSVACEYLLPRITWKEPFGPRTDILNEDLVCVYLELQENDS